MRSGVVIVSGTTELASESFQQALPAVYRRIHCTAKLTWMSEDDVRLYFKHFLQRFLDKRTSIEWNNWADEFMKDSPWASSMDVSIDMLQQFLMSQITTAVASKYAYETENTVQVLDDRRDEFFKLICDSPSAKKILLDYAPVAKAW